MESKVPAHLNNMSLFFRLLVFTLLLSVNGVLMAQYSYPRTDVTTAQPFLQKDLSINLTLTLENASAQTYSLSWEVLDTSSRQLGPNEELHCFVRDQSGLIGVYQGLSTPMTHCDFQSEEKRITVFFKVRDKQFPNSAPSSTDTSHMTVVVQRIDIMRFQCDQSEYEAFKLNLGQNYSSMVTLKNNERILYLSHRNANAMFPNEMPQLGCFYNLTLCLDRYYINRTTGRILPGRRWMARKSVKRLIHNSRLELINPEATYRFKDGIELTGHELIKKRRASTLYFALLENSSTRGIAPY